MRAYARAQTAAEGRARDGKPAARFPPPPPELAEAMRVSWDRIGPGEWAMLDMAWFEEATDLLATYAEARQHASEDAERSAAQQAPAAKRGARR